MFDSPPVDSADDVLQSRFGLSEFRPGQRQVIDALLERGAALAVFPTGGGKSLCYQLPALLLVGVTLVVSPLIALMKDQIEYLARRGIRAARLDSSLTTTEIRETGELLRNGLLKLLYVAPERFNNEGFLDDLQRSQIALFAVDEAHCISEWGHNFRPDYLKLATTARELGVERVLALTATATPAVVKDICAAFAIPRECAVVTGFHRPNLVLLTTPVAEAEREAVLRERLQMRPRGPTIVYVTLQRTAEELAVQLTHAGLSARAYHAGMETTERTEVQNWWTASRDAIVVATIAFGMGIDKADVRYVYHYNLPKSLESYSQEIGRAGRDGAPATVELLACAADIPTIENFTYGDTPSHAALLDMVSYLLEAGEAFDVSVYELSVRFDIRPLVVRTILTYLELLGIVHQLTPYYGTYELCPLQSVSAMLARVPPADRGLVERVLAAARKGRTWFKLDPAAAAASLGVDRERILRVLHWLDDHGLAELRASEARLRFTRVDSCGARPEAVADGLAERFARRESEDLARLRQVLSLVAEPGCQTAALVYHFGERLGEPCGHCSSCLASGPGAGAGPGPGRQLVPEPRRPEIDMRVQRETVRALQSAHPNALGEARQLTRLLCGLNSPALTATKLSRHALFGALEKYPFAEVQEWCSAR